MEKTKEYEDKLRDMIQSRTGKDCEPWLYPQIKYAAMNMVILDKVFDELLDTETLLTMEEGYNKQAKKEVNPLLAYYNQLQKTLIMQYEALGLNYRAAPKKINENTKKGGEEHDKLSVLMNDVKNA